MRSSTIALALSAASFSSASPLLVKKANYDPLPGGDIDILNYALTLEYLERKFYQEGLQNYTQIDLCNAGFKEEFYHNLKIIYEDEKSHVDFLAGALGSKAIPEPSFKFPVADPKSFVTLSAVLEGVGVSAYLGAASVIADKAYVTAAGSILTVEARHASYVRAALGEKPFPKAYDTPLNFNQVYSLAAQFVTGFAPGTPALPFKAFPPLTAVSDKTPSVAGVSNVTFVGAYKAASGSKLVTADTPVYAVLFSGLDTYYAKVATHGDNYVLPKLPGANFTKAGEAPPSGQSYVVLSTANGTSKVSDENTISGVGILEVLAKW